MKRLIIAIGLISMGLPTPVSSQDIGAGEIIVTAQRREQEDYSSYMPAVGLRRPADFLVQEVVVRGDTRDEKERRREIFSMIEKALALAERQGVSLAYGDYVVQQLTAMN